MSNSSRSFQAQLIRSLASLSWLKIRGPTLIDSTERMKEKEKSAAFLSSHRRLLSLMKVNIIRFIQSEARKKQQIFPSPAKLKRTPLPLRFEKYGAGHWLPFRSETDIPSLAHVHHLPTRNRFSEAHTTLQTASVGPQKVPTSGNIISFLEPRREIGSNWYEKWSKPSSSSTATMGGIRAGTAGGLHFWFRNPADSYFLRLTREEVV